MKKSVIRVLAFVLVCAALCAAFASCGKTISGTYSAEALGTGATLTFKGSKVTTTYKAVGAIVYTVEGKYEIKDNQITITYEGEKADEAKDYAGTFTFEQGKNDSGKEYIKIGLVTYTKAD